MNRRETAIQVDRPAGAKWKVKRGMRKTKGEKEHRKSPRENVREIKEN